MLSYSTAAKRLKPAEDAPANRYAVLAQPNRREISPDTRAALSKYIEVVRPLLFYAEQQAGVLLVYNAYIRI